MQVTSFYSFLHNVLNIFLFNSIPNSEIFGYCNIRVYADNKKWDKKLKFVLGRVENNVRKGENAAYQAFFNVFKSFLSKGCKARIVW